MMRCDESEEFQEGLKLLRVGAVRGERYEAETDKCHGSIRAWPYKTMSFDYIKKSYLRSLLKERSAILL